MGKLKDLMLILINIYIKSDIKIDISDSKHETELYTFCVIKQSKCFWGDFDTKELSQISALCAQIF